MLRILIIFLFLVGSAYADENWQLKYEKLAEKQVQLIDENIQLRAMVLSLSTQVFRQNEIEKRNLSAVLKGELKRLDEVKKAKVKEAEE